MDKKSPSGRRTKRSNKVVEDNHWDCSVCTYRNTAEAFKCLVCDVRKGTSTRKPRINPQLVQQQFNPAPPKAKREKSDKKSSVSDLRDRKKKHHLRKLRNVDRASAETREVTVNNITVTITEYKPIPHSISLSEESESGSEAPSHHSGQSADSDARGEMKVMRKIMGGKDQVAKAENDMKKLRALQQKGLQRRRAEKDKNLASALDKIGKIMSSQPVHEETATESQEIPAKFVEEVKIAERAPGHQMLVPSLFGRIFTEDTLDPAKFVPSDTRLYGYTGSTLNAQFLRKILLSRTYNLRNDPLGSGIGLYVLHLMACSTCPHLVRSCGEFLHRDPVRVSAQQFLYILLNLGINNDYSVEVDVPKHLSSNGSGRNDAPTDNIEQVMNYLCQCVNENLIDCDSTARPLVNLLSKLALDESIRACSLLSTVIGALSLLVAKCQSSVGPDVVAHWLLAEHKDLLNIVEIFRLVVRATGAMQTALFIGAMSQTLGDVVTGPMGKSQRIEPKDLRDSMRALSGLASAEPLKCYVALHLLIAALPSIAMSQKDCDKSYRLLSNFVQTAGESNSDEVRVRGAAMQLRTLIMMATTTSEPVTAI